MNDFVRGIVVHPVRNKQMSAIHITSDDDNNVENVYNVLLFWSSYKHKHYKQCFMLCGYKSDNVNVASCYCCFHSDTSNSYILY